MLVFNPIIVITVLRKFYGRIRMNSQGGSEARRMFTKILLLGILFEATCILRIILVYFQDDWKEHDTKRYNIVFTLYIFFGEISC